jgi:hypothetical protein
MHLIDKTLHCIHICKTEQWELAEVRMIIVIRVRSQHGERKRHIARSRGEPLRISEEILGPHLIEVDNVECRSSSSKDLIRKRGASIDEAINGLHFPPETAAARDHHFPFRRIFATSFPSLNTSTVGPLVDLAVSRNVYFTPSF